MNTALGQAIERLEAAVRDEGVALAAGDIAALSEIIRRKNHGLLELSRLGRRSTAEDLDEAARERLRALRTLLDENVTLLERHLKASRSLADSLAEAITARESDGTYSGPMGQRRSA